MTSKTTNKFSSEVRARAVGMVLDREGEHASRWAAEKQAVDAATWLEAAMKLNALSGNEADKYFEMEQAVARERVGYLADGMLPPQPRCTLRPAKPIKRRASREPLSSRSRKRYG